MAWEVIRLVDGKLSVRADGEEVWILSSPHGRRDPDVKYASEIERMLNQIPVVSCME